MDHTCKSVNVREYNITIYARYTADADDADDEYTVFFLPMQRIRKKNQEKKWNPWMGQYTNSHFYRSLLTISASNNFNTRHTIHSHIV